MSRYRSPGSNAFSVRDSGNSDPQRRRFEGPFYWWARVNDLPAWPKPVTTDADGRFSMHGVGRDLQATLSIIDSRFARQMFDVETENSPEAKLVTLALRPAQIITGRVTYADTGKPVPDALLDSSMPGAEGNAGPDRPTSRPIPTGGSGRILRRATNSSSRPVLPPGRFTLPPPRDSSGPKGRSSIPSTCPCPAAC